MVIVFPKLDQVIPGHVYYPVKNIKIHEINELKQRDIAIGLLKLEGKSTVIASIYLD